MNQFFKKLTYWGLNLLSAAGRLLVSSPRVAILMYHSVGDNPAFFTVTPKDFARQMAYLKKQGFRVVSLGQIVNSLEKGEKLTDKTAALTFDDGYVDNFVNAWPVLKKYNFPATIFLTTGYFGQLLGNSQGGQIKILDEAQVKEMARSDLIEFGSHTQSHPRLAEISDIDFAKEAQVSKETIERITGKDCRFFAYPRGYWRESFFGVLKGLGYKAACSVQEGLIRTGDNPFCLKRNMVYERGGLVEFKGKLTYSVIIYNWLKSL